MLLEFPSVVAAVECAILIQKMMAERNASLAEAKRVLYRMGVNLGDVLIDGEDILGDGVNVAARLEGICQPGGVCVSGAAYEHVAGRIAVDFTDLGEQALKNIDKSVRVFGLSAQAVGEAKIDLPAPDAAARIATPLRSRDLSPAVRAIAAALAVVVLAAGAYGWRAGYAPRFMAASVDDKLANAPRLSIVVLPFENLSGDKEQDYFADGVTDDLTTDLSHLQDSFVISRGTAFTYKGKQIDAKQIGRELGVRYLLEGSVRRVGESITINAQLISTETGAHVWADRFDGERGKLGELQVEVVSRLANSLGAELVKAEALRSMRERPNNPDLTDLAMRGQAALYRNSDDAMSLFEQALALDPRNARALTGLTNALVWRALFYLAVDPAKAASDAARAEKLIDQALSLQPDNSQAHVWKGWVYFLKQQWASAMAETTTAIADDPNNANAHSVAGFWKLFMGRGEDGFAGVENALRLSPRDPFLPNWQYWVCHLHTHLAQWEKAIEWCSKSITNNGGDTFNLVDLAAASAWAGHDKEAKAAAAQLQKVNPDFTVQGWAGIHWTDDPTFNAQYARIVDGLRKAGVPEGEKKTD